MKLTRIVEINHMTDDAWVLVTLANPEWELSPGTRLVADGYGTVVPEGRYRERGAIVGQVPAPSDIQDLPPAPDGRVWLRRADVRPRLAVKYRSRWKSSTCDACGAYNEGGWGRAPYYEEELRGRAREQPLFAVGAMERHGGQPYNEKRTRVYPNITLCRTCASTLHGALGEFLENGNDVVKVGDWPGPEPWEENGTLPAIKRHTIQRDEADAAIASLERAIEKRKAEVAKHAEALSILT